MVTDEKVTEGLRLIAEGLALASEPKEIDPTEHELEAMKSASFACFEVLRDNDEYLFDGEVQRISEAIVAGFEAGWEAGRQYVESVKLERAA